MKLEEIEKLCDKITKAPWESYGSQIRRPVNDGFEFIGRINFHHDALFVAASRELMPKLVAVAKAASNEAILWNEELCNRKESDQMYEAQEALKKALKELEGL